ncbi:DNA ligase (ATP) [Rhodococcus opacus M213]|uniref:DNA ligase (ATP) n=1 Tax=Rhodococcus opacus M213 TaxID=1129896 RepID=K8XJI9_RHOOP|nr:DNA ligase (ATP) [Rhodococcus opacus M213]
MEMKFDGVRAVATITPAAVHLFSRNNADITAAYPEIASGLSEIDPGRGVIVDGEIVAPAASSGRPRFDLLQQRTPIQDPPPMLQRAVPVAFYIFDLLTHRGAPILRWPYLERRQLLADLNLDLGGEALHVPPTNSKKSDSDAASWLPPNKSYRWTYVSRQIDVKALYRLWVTQAEKDAMSQVPHSC